MKLQFSLIKKFIFRYKQNNANPIVKVICTGVSLILFLSVIRADIVNIEWTLGYSLITYLPRVLIAAYYDFCFTLVLTLFFLLLLFLVRNKKKLHNTIYYFYTITAILTLITAIFNTQIINIIGSPFTYQWFYYSDFMGSLDAQNAVLANISWKLSVKIILAGTLMLILSELLTITCVHFSFTQQLNSRFFLISGVFLALYSFTFIWYKNYKGWPYARLANPITFYIQSTIKSDNSSSLFTMEVSSGFEDTPAIKSELVTSTFKSHSSQNKIKNVVIFVLESVPAEYIEVYGGKYPVTPEINKLIPKSMWFKNIYAHSPATNNSMVSILGSIYPWISFKSLTKEHPEIKLHTLSTLLKQNNYRTAFYNAGDIRFQRANEFLSNQQFDKIEDFSSKYCRNKQFIVKGERWDNPDGADDECMVESFSEWIDTDVERPFFATLWTVQTHYPYFYAGEENDYKVNNPDLNRYLNALHHSDQSLGKLINSLKKRGLEESTLIVIVGDHGEAFGRHNQFTHASKIYEENVHVPLILVNEQLFQGERNDVIGGHIDIAPTIMNILDFPVEEQWQGQSLFSTQRSGRTYFFAPWSEFLFGFREKNYKFIYNATRNTTEVYDLEIDSTEIINLANQLPPAYLSKGHQRLAAWIQYHNKFMKTSMNK